MNTNRKPRPAGQRRFIIGICLASFAGCLDFTVVNTALPAIREQFSAGLNTLQWVMTLFVMALCCCMVLATRLGERYGSRSVLYGGMLVFSLASLSAGLAPGLPVLIVSRLFQGAGCAVLYTATTAMLVEVIPESRRGRALGILFAANGLGLTLGPVAGGVLVELSGWRAIFLINVPLMLASYLCCRGAIKTSVERPAIRIDFPGWLLMSTGVVPVLVWSAHVDRWGVISLPSIILLLTAVTALCLFTVRERRIAEPLIDLSLISVVLFRRACLLSIFLAVFYCASFFLLPFKLLAIYPLTSAELGLMLLPVTLVMALTSPLAGKLADRFGAWPVLAGGFILLSLSAMLQSTFAAPQSSCTLMTAFALMGIGWGAVLGPGVAAALCTLPLSQHGQGIGISWTLHNLGGALGLTVATHIFQSGGLVSGYRWVMWLLAGLSCAGAIIALIAWRSTGRRATDAVAVEE